MKPWRVLFLVPLLTLSSRPLPAVIGAADPVPAATLLVPYFEVDLGEADGITTLISVNNASAEPAIAHVTLWSDLSVPTLDFNVYLTGYDVVTFNLRDLFTTGTVPSTSHNNAAVSPVGRFSALTNASTGVGPGSTSCDTQLPLPRLPASLLAHIRAAHTGQASATFAGRCAGVDLDDQIARGYITIDNVNVCSLDFPGDAGYFAAGGTGIANNENQLWGDVFYVDGAENSAYGTPLVHLEASDSLGAANYTFYRRYSGGADQREGLPTVFSTRFTVGGAFSGGTDLLVWRDAKRTIAPFSCALFAPPPFPLAINALALFDESENVLVAEQIPFSPQPPAASLLPFSREALRVTLDSDEFGGLPLEFGWLFMNLNSPVAGSQVPFEPLMQAWVTTVMKADGRFSVGFDAVQTTTVTFPAEGDDTILPVCDGDPDPEECS